MVRTVLGPDTGRGDGRHTHARAHPARHVELVEAAVLRLRHRVSPSVPLDISMIGELRMNPFLNRDNCGLFDVKAAIEELNAFVEYGGRTVVDPTNVGIGRDPSALQRDQPPHWAQHRDGRGLLSRAVASRTTSRPMSVEAIAEAIAADCGVSEDEPEVCAGIIGEIGVSKDFTPAEEKVLRGRRARLEDQRRAPDRSPAGLGAARPPRAGRRRERRRRPPAHRALPHEPESARSQVPAQPRRPRRLHEYDMIGMDYFYADQQAQSPSRRGERDRHLQAGRGRLPQLDPHVAGRVPQDDADALRRLRIRIHPSPLRSASQTSRDGPGDDRPHPDREPAPRFLRRTPGDVSTGRGGHDRQAVQSSARRRSPGSRRRTTSRASTSSRR